MQPDVIPLAPRGQPPAASDDVYPPQTSRAAEIETLVELLRGVFPDREAIYVSTPITSGQRFIDWFARRGNPGGSPQQSLHDFSSDVVVPNRNAAKALVERVRQAHAGPIIDPTAVRDVEGWTQGDYRTAWARVIEEFVRKIVFADGWEFSSGCSYEFVVATKAGIETLDERWNPITRAAGVLLLRRAINEISSRGLSAEFLCGILEDLESFGTLSPSETAADLDWLRGAGYLKDSVLDSLSNHGNVAQFVSFSPSLEIRYSRIAGHPPNETFPSARNAIASLLEASPEGSLNVRSYHPENPKSREFIYALRDLDSVEASVRRLSGQGLYTIVNETIDVNDGGVSGVALGDVMEFAPGDTPRCVEKPGALSLPRAVAMSMLQRVYGFAPALPNGRWRLEFSIHPIPRGYRRGHTILWEAEHDTAGQHPPHPRWPNRFSRFLGDKAFGLLLADCFGFRVPLTVTVGRNVAPFVFGRSTGTGETWVRTCPSEPVPGKFSTLRGWTDPFKLLAQEDPEGRDLVAVLSQEGVSSTFSGASIGTKQKEPAVEGVEGIGSEFMLGRMAPQRLPLAVIDAVKKLTESVAAVVGGTVKLEWAHDGQSPWILQMQQIVHASDGAVVVPGEAARFRRFNVAEGIERFRDFVADSTARGDGIIVVGSVGVTSHFGDILRRSGVPSRIEPLSHSQ